MGRAAAVGTSEAGYNDTGGGVREEMSGPPALLSLLGLQPKGDRFCDGAQVVQVPVGSPPALQVAAHPGCQPARTPGAAHVEIETTRERELTESAYGERGGLCEAESQRIEPGLGIPLQPQNEASIRCRHSSPPSHVSSTPRPAAKLPRASIILRECSGVITQRTSPSWEAGRARAASPSMIKKMPAILRACTRQSLSIALLTPRRAEEREGPPRRSPSISPPSQSA